MWKFDRLTIYKSHRPFSLLPRVVSWKREYDRYITTVTYQTLFFNLTIDLMVHKKRKNELY